MTDNYELLRDAYTGGGGFEDGRYLFMHSREEPEDYLLRKKMARYSNFVKVIIHSLTNPIFKKTIVRDFDDNEMLKQFVEDVDGSGTTLNAFMKKAAKMARLFGRIFIVVDNFAAEEQAVNQKTRSNSGFSRISIRSTPSRSRTTKPTAPDASSAFPTS